MSEIDSKISVPFPASLKICYLATFTLLIVADGVAVTKSSNSKNIHKVAILPNFLCSIAVTWTVTRCFPF